MNKAAAFTLFLLITSFFAFSQNSKSLLEWNEYYLLSWDDFEGLPSEKAFGDAATAVQIKAKPYYVGKEIRYDVYAYFDRAKSWTLDRSAALLAHEQLHFDIAELYARKIRQRISELSAEGNNDLDIYNAAIRQLLEESNEADASYDRETLHGAIVKRQDAWMQKVANGLTILADYKKRKTVIGVKKLKGQPHIFSKKKLVD
jgi:hypothetical protein